MPDGKDITEVFQDAYPGLCRFLESILGKNTIAQDLAQESFLRLCEAEPGSIPVPELRFWLFRVGRNLALNELNRKKVHKRLWENVILLFSRTEPDPEEELLNAENAEIMRLLLDSLPEHQRSALLLREHEEMSYREISVVLGISQNKVKIDIYRSRQALRKLWSEHRHAKGENK